MATTYRKTSKGISEIETRAHRLMPRLRSALIMVDGKRTDDDLRPMLQQHTDETLLWLVAQGFIEVVSVTEVRVAAPALAAAAAPAAAARAHPASVPMAPAASAAASPATAAPSGPALDALRRDAVRQLNDQVGPGAETLAIKLERARRADELRPLLEAAWKLIGNVRGAQAAAAFRARFMSW